MDEMSLDARFAKNNINILSVAQTHDGVAVIYEYQWRPQPGVGKWQKSMIIVPDVAWALRGKDSTWAEQLLEHVTSVRKQLER